MLKGKKILLGISGSTAAYKAAELSRLLIHHNAEVQVVLTKAACKFITPLTFASLTGKKAHSADCVGGPDRAIEIARESDLAIVAPATARTLDKVAHDTEVDFLSTALHACQCPVVIAPSMKVSMWNDPKVQDNVLKVRDMPRHYVVPPGTGVTACGEFGDGRMAEPLDIFDYAMWALSGGRRDLVGERITVTAGPTMEDFDPVRYLTNRSTGKMGYAIARQAALRGASVRILSAKDLLAVPPGCKFIPTRTAHSMDKAVWDCLPTTSVLIMSAAIADYTPTGYQNAKIKKRTGDDIKLKRTDDILANLPPDPNRITVGFAAETQDLVGNAALKLSAKRLDMIVANDVSVEDCGFGTDTNRVTILEWGHTPSAHILSSVLPLMHKTKVADEILDRVVKLRKNPNRRIYGVKDAPSESPQEHFTL